MIDTESGLILCTLGRWQRRPMVRSDAGGASIASLPQPYRNAPCLPEGRMRDWHHASPAMRSSAIFAELSTPGRPAPGCVPAPTK